MRSIVWTGDRIPTQDWGWTTETAEPWYDAGNFRGYFHCGIDIPMDTGEPLRAARAGRVAAVGVGFLAIAVGGEMDWYLHGSRYIVSRGQAIAHGELIGYAGDVAPPGGASFGSHLHFERQSTLRLQCNFPAASRDPVPILTAPDPQPVVITHPKRRSALVVYGPVFNVIGRGTDGAVYHARSSDDMASWSATTRLGGPTSFEAADEVPEVLVRPNGKIDVAIRGKDGRPWKISSPDLGATWDAEWTEYLPGDVFSNPLVIVGGPPPAGQAGAAVDLSEIKASLIALKSELDTVAVSGAAVVHLEAALVAAGVALGKA